ncbi:MAG: ribosome recycling factor [Solirubrobacterales bacterium]|nr:ribosome recycling factor [Solirubrobacterales bacterium]
MVSDLLSDAGQRMEKSVEATRHEFATVRAGRATPSLLDRVSVEYYGTYTPLKQLATISAPEPKLLSIQPFDKGSMKSIEKAIMDSDLGLTPSNDGGVIRLTLPELTEERRREMVKVARKIAEDGRVKVRNIRRDIMQDLRELKDDGELGSDDEHRAEADLQKVTDTHVHEVDEALAAKEAEILEV